MLEKGTKYMSVNKVILLGRIVRDPISKMLPNGTAVSQFTLATSQTWIDQKSKKKRESVEFHQVVCWGKIATVANKYLSKGGRVYLEGGLRTSSWEDKSKQKHYKVEVLVSSLTMLGGGQKEGAQAETVEEDVPMIKK